MSSMQPTQKQAWKQNGTVKFTMELPAALAEELTRVADLRLISRAALIRQWIQERLDAERQKSVIGEMP